MTTKATADPEARPGPAPSEPPGGVTAPRPMRADAVKNRARILEAAEEVFATEGVSVPVDTVAERAGVGVGTLYRHFPTKEALFEAIVRARLEALLASVKQRGDDPEPGAALFGFLGEFARHASAKRDLFEALSSAGIDIKSQCSELVDEIKHDVDRLRQRAVATGSVRPDVSTDEMFGIVVGVCQASGQIQVDDRSRERMVTVLCDGLRPPARRSTSG